MHGKERTTAQKVGSDRVSREIVLLTHICAKFSRLRRVERVRSLRGSGLITPGAARTKRRISSEHGRWYICRHAGASGGRRGARASPSNPPPSRIPHRINSTPFLLPDFFLSAAGSPTLTRLASRRPRRRSTRSGFRTTRARVKTRWLCTWKAQRFPSGVYRATSWSTGAGSR